MKNAFESCDMWDVVDGAETMPTDTTTAQYRIWKKKDNLAKAMITQCIKSDLVIKVAHAKTSTESWNMFASEYSQTGSGSIMLWFRRLTKQLSPGSDVSAHVTGFQEAIRYLANAEFEIPGYIAAAILLSTLPSDPQDLNPGTTMLPASRSINAPLPSRLSLTAFLKRNDGSPRTTRPERRKRRTLLRPSKMQLIRVARNTAAITKAKVTILRTVTRMVATRRGDMIRRRRGSQVEGRRAKRKPTLLTP
jgi:hypothetical protein